MPTHVHARQQMKAEKNARRDMQKTSLLSQCEMMSSGSLSEKINYFCTSMMLAYIAFPARLRRKRRRAQPGRCRVPSEVAAAAFSTERVTFFAIFGVRLCSMRPPPRSRDTDACRVSSVGNSRLPSLPKHATHVGQCRRPQPFDTTLGAYIEHIFRKVAPHHEH